MGSDDAAKVVAAITQLRTTLTHSPPRPGTCFRAFVARPGAFSYVDLSPGEHTVVGTHRKCGLSLPDHDGVLTRHLIAVVGKASRSLRLLDLHTSVPFLLLGDEPHVSLVASGTFAVRVAGAVVGALSIEVESTGAPSPPLEFDRSDSVPANTPPGRITSLPGISHVSLLPGMGSAPRASAFEGPAYRIEVENEGRSACVEATSLRLDLGILVGRASNCSDEELRRVLDKGISRAHALVLRDKDGVAVYDLASLNGLYLDGRRVPSVPVPRGGVSVRLAARAQLRVSPVLDA